MSTLRIGEYVHIFNKDGALDKSIPYKEIPLFTRMSMIYKEAARRNVNAKPIVPTSGRKLKSR